MTSSSNKVRRLRAVAALALAAAIGAPAATPAQAAGTAARQQVAHRDVIVQGQPGALPAIRDAVADAGGTVTRDLAIVDGVAASVPASGLARLAASRAVVAVTPDRAVRMQGAEGPVAAAPATSGSHYRSVFREVVGADVAERLGITGAGQTVALIDTGVADIPDLAGTAVTVHDDVQGTSDSCLNLSGDPGCGDSFGHGTFMAGLIAGNGAASGGRYRGVAPGSKILSVKIAGPDGSADVSSVLAGIQFVVAHRERYGVKVLNLSLGTDSTQSAEVDPLNYAVQRAWASGITVVVAASNRGPEAGTISKPADDPYVLTVGAIDDRTTRGAGDDAVPLFSAKGPTAADGIAKPDVVAPGARVVSLSAPGSSIDVRFPSELGPAYRKGSGTSMAAAITSGVAALLSQAWPSATPDRIKHAIVTGASKAPVSDRMLVGSGVVDVVGATRAPAGLANQGLTRSSGLGSLDLSRGTVRVLAQDPRRTVVEGMLTLQLLTWDPYGYTSGDWSGSSWYGSSWYGSSWYGSSWYGSSWYGSSWYGAVKEKGTVPGLYGSSWYGSSWYGAWPT